MRTARGVRERLRGAKAVSMQFGKRCSVFPRVANLRKVCRFGLGVASSFKFQAVFPKVVQDLPDFGDDEASPLQTFSVGVEANLSACEVQFSGKENRGSSPAEIARPRLNNKLLGLLTVRRSHGAETDPNFSPKLGTGVITLHGLHAVVTARQLIDCVEHAQSDFVLFRCKTNWSENVFSRHRPYTCDLGDGLTTNCCATVMVRQPADHACRELSLTDCSEVTNRSICHESSAGIEMTLDDSRRRFALAGLSVWIGRFAECGGVSGIYATARQ